MMGREAGTRIGPIERKPRPTSIGEAVYRARIAKQLTFLDLVKLSGLSRRTLIALENAPAPVTEPRPDPYGRYAGVQQYRRETRMGYQSVRRLNDALGLDIRQEALKIQEERAAERRRRSQKVRKAPARVAPRKRAKVRRVMPRRRK